MKALRHSLYLSLVALAFLSVGHSCSCQEEEIVTISVDFRKTIEVDINHIPDIQTIVFDQTDVLLSGQGSTLFNDEVILLRERDNLLAFDHHGKFLNVVAERGRGPGEYSYISSLFVDGEQIFLQNHRFVMQVYTLNGTLIKETVLSKTPQGAAPSMIYPAGDGQFVGRASADNLDSLGYAIGLLDADCKLVRPIEGRNYLADIALGYDQFSPFEDDLLFWDTCCDTIFTIKNKERISPTYVVDFGVNGIPKDVAKKGAYPVMFFLEENVDKGQYISFLRSIHECQRYLTAFFTLYGGGDYLLRYDKQMKLAQSYKFVDANETIIPFLVVHTKGDKVMFLSSKGEEVTLNIINPSDLP